ncbi:hypothetical protein DOTSEDRAFT_45948 [Lecanosticta acicola]|uniref:Transcriptional coactivator HFI1/ADA1 n=1 Tax=Lecanosticta acicola TaxID=111012 RepID=A0AAI8YYE9_9PEZI|nr:hypothetical protein DOTSEDRAFT_45948 [Lecanosticta acicola]
MNPAELTLTISPNLTKALPNNIAAQKSNVAPSKTTLERLNLEPIYTQLKSALGEQWGEYQAVLKQFVLGSLNQAELSWVLQPLLSPAQSVVTSTDSSKSPLSTLHLHNTLVNAIYANTLRDPPPAEIAPWVVATDKPTSTSKNAGAGSGANDKVEERLKREVMLWGPRDRKRIKTSNEGMKPVNQSFQEIRDYASELAVQPPSSQSQAQTEPQSATATAPSGSGLAKTNFEIEIRRRFASTLAQEALEFPALNEIQSRIEPISYETGLSGVQQGSLQGCAELIEQATEVYVKEMLGSLLAHARSNVPGVASIQTNKFKQRLRQEEMDAERGVLQRNAAGLLPVEMEIQANRQALDMQDLRLGLKLDDSFLKTDRFLDESIMLSQYPDLHQNSKMNGTLLGNGRPLTNGVSSKIERAPTADVPDLDDTDFGHWKGTTKKDSDNLMSTLDDCLLAVG